EGLREDETNRTGRGRKGGEGILGGGWLYWVIRGEVAAREKIIGIEPFRDKDGIGRCRLLMQPKVIPVSPRPMRPFQGWRYYAEDSVPPDLGKATAGSVAAMPEPLRRELRDLGLLEGRTGLHGGIVYQPRRAKLGRNQDAQAAVLEGPNRPQRDRVT